MRVLPCKLCEGRFKFVDCGKAKNPLVESPDKGVVCLAEVRGNFDDVVENRLQLARRLANDA